MITPIQGKNVLFAVKRDGVYTAIACAKSVNIDFEVEDIETTTVDSGTDREYVSGFSSANVSLESVITIDQLSKYQFEEFITNRRTVHDCKMIFTNYFGDILQYVFNAKIKTISASGQVGSLSIGAITLKVSGAITPTKTYDHALIGGDGNLILNGDGDLIRTN